VRTGGRGKHNFLSGGVFRFAKYEKLRRRNPSSRTLCVHYGARSEGGAGIHFPHTPFSSRPARAEKFFALPREARQSKFKIWIFVKKGSDFVQKVPPIGKSSFWLARYAGSPPDFERKIEFFVFVPRNGTPEAGFSNLKL